MPNFANFATKLKQARVSLVKRELNRVKNMLTIMQEDDNDVGVTSEDTEILNLPLFT